MEDKPFSDLEIEGDLIGSPELDTLADALKTRENRCFCLLMYFWNVVRKKRPRGIFTEEQATEWLSFAARKSEIDLPGSAILTCLRVAGWIVRSGDGLTPKGWGKRYDKIFEHRADMAKRQAEKRDKASGKFTDSLCKPNGKFGVSISPLPLPLPKPNTNTEDNIKTAANAPDSLVPFADAIPPKPKKRRAAKRTVALPPELEPLIAAWRKPVNRSEVAELAAARIAEGFTVAEIAAGGMAYLATRKGEDVKFDYMLETFIGPKTWFKTDWAKTPRKPLGNHYTPGNSNIAGYLPYISGTPEYRERVAREQATKTPAEAFPSDSDDSAPLDTLEPPNDFPDATGTYGDEA